MKLKRYIMFDLEDFAQMEGILPAPIDPHDTHGGN